MRNFQRLGVDGAASNFTFDLTENLPR